MTPPAAVAIRHVRQESLYDCGQACLAMLTGEPLERVKQELPNRSGTRTREIRSYLIARGWGVGERLIVKQSLLDIPDLCLVKVLPPDGRRTGRWHWSVVAPDPESGALAVLDPAIDGTVLLGRYPHYRISSYLELMQPERRSG